MAILGVGRWALDHPFADSVFPSGASIVQDGAFLVTISAPVIFIGMSWTGFHFCGAAE
jgi:hypothetical protein